MDRAEAESMTDTAWKQLERRIATAWGGRRAGPLGAAVSDCVNVPLAIEVKRSKAQSIRSAWVQQAKAQGKAEGKDWLLVVAGHYDARPIAVCDHAFLLELARRAGLVEEQAA